MKKIERKVTFKDFARMFDKLRASGVPVEEIMECEVDLYALDLVGGVR